MGMEGSAAEYEKLALAAVRQAGAESSDPTYHNTRAAIFATLAQAAAASETAEAVAALARSASASSH